MLNLFISYFYSSDKYSEIVAVTAGASVLFNKSSSDDRPGPGICSCKYVEDAKAARSVRVWDRVPIKKQCEGGKSSQAQPPVLAPPSTFLTPICSIFHIFSIRLTKIAKLSLLQAEHPCYLTSRHQTTGRVRVFAFANTWRT